MSAFDREAQAQLLAERYRQGLESLENTVVSKLPELVLSIFESMGTSGDRVVLAASRDVWVDLLICHARRYKDDASLSAVLLAAAERKRWEHDWESTKWEFKTFPPRWAGECMRLKQDGGNFVYGRVVRALFLTNDYRFIRPIIGDVLGDEGFTLEEINAMNIDGWLKEKIIKGCPLLRGQAEEGVKQSFLEPFRAWWKEMQAWWCERPLLF